MTDQRPLPPPSDGERDDALASPLASGAHDEALVHLVAGAAVPDPRAALADPAWDDDRFLAWWAAESRARTARAAQRAPDAAVLAAGRALQAQIAARALGVRWRADAPALAPPAVAGPPTRVLGSAALMRQAPVVELPVAAGAGREVWDEPATSWLALPRDLDAGRYLALRISGDSMEPLMHTGDTILVALGAPARAGEAVVARHPDDGYVCKRVRRVRATALELESLAPGRPVLTIPRDESLLVGRVVAVWCQHCAAERAT
jgi:SOS-response transcriptional repressor LexA